MGVLLRSRIPALRISHLTFDAKHENENGLQSKFWSDTASQDPRRTACGTVHVGNGVGYKRAGNEHYCMGELSYICLVPMEDARQRGEIDDPRTAQPLAEAKQVPESGEAPRNRGRCGSVCEDFQGISIDGSAVFERAHPARPALIGYRPRLTLNLSQEKSTNMSLRIAR